MMGRCPFGGQTWLYLNWLRALSTLGHEVWYIEDDCPWPFHPLQNSPSDDCSYAVAHVASCLERIGLPDRWAFRLGDRPDACWGLSLARLHELYRTCDALLNVCGATLLRDEQRAARVRVYLETDPVTAELRLARGDRRMRRMFSDHNRFVTYGENYGSDRCSVPLHGIDWKKTRQPIDLELWPMTFDPQATHFTTIGNYRQQGSDVEYKGEVYRWSKHHEWEKFLDLPRRVEQSFQVALKVDEQQDRRRLRAHGWQLRCPVGMSLDTFGAYPNYFRRSRAEFSVAKDQNVRLWSGWFSERDVCYLATGKPVVAQDTGFSDILPTGEGLFAVSTVDEAAAAVEAINRDYERQCRAAREIAREYFAADRLGPQLLEAIGLS